MINCVNTGTNVDFYKRYQFQNMYPGQSKAIVELNESLYKQVYLIKKPKVTYV